MFALQAIQISIEQVQVRISFLRKEIELFSFLRSKNGIQKSHLPAICDKLVPPPRPVIKQTFDFLRAFVIFHVVRYKNPVYSSVQI